MIPRKKKICEGCGNEKYIFGKGLCDYCYKSKQKKIKQISEHHKKTLDEYSPKRKVFLEKRKYCELKLNGCTHLSTCVHHKKGKHSKQLYLDEKFWMASCINCNRVVEEIGEKAYELGLKIKHNSI